MREKKRKFKEEMKGKYAINREKEIDMKNSFAELFTYEIFTNLSDRILPWSIDDIM